MRSPMAYAAVAPVVALLALQFFAMLAGWAVAESRGLTAVARSRWVARPFAASAFCRRRSPLAASYPARSVVIYTKTGDKGRSSLFTG